MAVTKLKWSTQADLSIIRNPSVLREEYLDYMTFRRNERPLFTEIFGPIVGLKEEWERQGASPAELDFSAFTFRTEARYSIPVQTGRLIQEEPEVEEETDEYIITRDDIGRRMKLSKGVATIPLPLNYPVKNMDDWLKIKPKYQFSPARFAPGWAEKTRKAQSEGNVICIDMPGGFDEPRQLLGEEELCYAFYEQPELIVDILETITGTIKQIVSHMQNCVQVDLLHVHEDMAGKSGSLVGPVQIDAYIKPYYLGIWNMLRELGARVFDQDSDGNMNSVIDSFLAAGVNCMHPIEPAAGMDPVVLRKKYGTRLAMYGGIDKHIIRTTKDEIDRELEYKLPPLIKSGGYIIALDHRIPNGTSINNYRYYVERVWEIIKREER